MSATATMPLPETATESLQISRFLRAEPTRVFEAWLNPESLTRWFTPGPMTVRHATVDARVGGAFRIEMEGPKPETPGVEQAVAVAAGVYTALEPGKLLAFTWGGNCSVEEDTLVTITLKPVDGGTELTLKHERFTVPGSAERHEYGWTGCLDKLVQLAPTI